MSFSTIKYNFWVIPVIFGGGQAVCNSADKKRFGFASLNPGWIPWEWLGEGNFGAAK